MIHAAMMMYYGIYSQGDTEGPTNLIAYPYITSSSDWGNVSDPTNGSELTYDQPDMNGGSNATLVKLAGTENHHVWYDFTGGLQDGVAFMLTMELKEGIAGFTGPFEAEFRVGDTVVSSTEITLTPDWQKHAFAFITNVEGLTGTHSLRLIGWGNGGAGDEVVIGEVVMSEIPEPSSYPETFDHTRFLSGSKWGKVDSNAEWVYGVEDSHGNNLATRITYTGPDNHHIYYDLDEPLEAQTPYTLTVRWKQGPTGFTGNASVEYRDGSDTLWSESVAVPTTWETQTFPFVPNVTATAPSIRLVGWDNGSDGDSIDFEFVHLTEGLEAPLTPLIPVGVPRPLSATEGWSTTGERTHDGDNGGATIGGEYSEFILDQGEHVRKTLDTPLQVGVQYTLSVVAYGGSFQMGYFDNGTLLNAEAALGSTSGYSQYDFTFTPSQSPEYPNIRLINNTDPDGTFYEFADIMLAKGPETVAFLLEDIQNILPFPYVTPDSEWQTVSDGSIIHYDEEDELGGTSGALIEINGPDNHQLWYDMVDESGAIAPLESGKSYQFRVFAKKGPAGFTGDFQMAYYSGGDAMNERKLPVPDTWEELSFSFVAGDDIHDDPSVRLIGWDGGIDGESVRIGKITLVELPEPELGDNPNLVSSDVSTGWDTTSSHTLTAVADSQGELNATRITLSGTSSHHLDFPLPETLEPEMPYTLSVKLKQGPNGYLDDFQMAYYDDGDEVIGQEVAVPDAWGVLSFSFIPWEITGPAEIRLIGSSNGADQAQIDIESVYLIKGTTAASH